MNVGGDQPSAGLAASAAGGGAGVLNRRFPPPAGRNVLKSVNGMVKTGAAVWRSESRFLFDALCNPVLNPILSGRDAGQYGAQGAGIPVSPRSSDGSNANRKAETANHPPQCSKARTDNTEGLSPAQYAPSGAIRADAGVVTRGPPEMTKQAGRR